MVAGRSPMRGNLLLLVVVSSACVTLTPSGARVAVYTAPLGGAPETRAMPDGCRRLAALPHPPGDLLSEQEMEGRADPFRKQRNAAGAIGGNVLLVLKKMITPRRNPECPNGVPIRDCAPDSGAWFSVEFESYECSAEALKALAAKK